MLLCTILLYLPSRGIVFSRNREIEWDLSRVRGKEHNTSHHWSCWAWSATYRSRIVAETYRIRYTACATWLWRGPTSIAPAKTSPVNKRQVVTRKCIWRSIANSDTKCGVFTQSLSCDLASRKFTRNWNIVKSSDSYIISIHNFHTSRRKENLLFNFICAINIQIKISWKKSTWRNSINSTNSVKKYILEKQF